MFTKQLSDCLLLGANENELRILYSSLLAYLVCLEVEPDRVGPEIELARDMIIAVRELLETIPEFAI